MRMRRPRTRLCRKACVRGSAFPAVDTPKLQSIVLLVCLRVGGACPRASSPWTGLCRVIDRVRQRARPKLTTSQGRPEARVLTIGKCGRTLAARALRRALIAGHHPPAVVSRANATTMSAKSSALDRGFCRKLRNAVSDSDPCSMNSAPKLTGTEPMMSSRSPAK